MIIKQLAHTCQTTIILFALFDLSSAGIQGKFHLTKPNICLRCDFNGGKKVKPCPADFSIANIKEKIEIIECGYQKPICGITVNITDKPTVIYAGCYSKKYNRHCFNDQVKQYGPANKSYCYHTCVGFFCNPYVSWLESDGLGFNLFKILG